MQSAAQMPMDPPVGELARAQACWAHAHITLHHLFTVELNQEMVNLLHSSATIAKDLSGVLIAFKVSSWLLAQEKVALRQETGWTLPARLDPGWTVAGGSPGGECSPQPSPGWAILPRDFIHCSLAACEESGGAGCCLLAYKCGLKKQSTEWFFK